MFTSLTSGSSLHDDCYSVSKHIVLMYEDRTQNYDPDIYDYEYDGDDEEYLIHDTPFPLPHHL